MLNLHWREGAMNGLGFVEAAELHSIVTHNSPDLKAVYALPLTSAPLELPWSISSVYVEPELAGIINRSATQ